MFLERMISIMRSLADGKANFDEFKKSTEAVSSLIRQRLKRLRTQQ
jgi:DNA-binding HxlR family transcriptional regulator